MSSCRPCPKPAQDLGANIGAMQMTMSVYIFGLAVGQLVYGPLSDRFGRRPILMTGLVLYTITGLAAAFVPNVDSLIVLRLLAGAWRLRRPGHRTRHRSRHRPSS